VKLKNVRLDRYYSKFSYVSRFASDTAVYIIPKKYATLNGSQKWKDTMREFVTDTYQYLKEYYKRENSEAGFSADKKLFGWEIAQRREDRINSVCSAQACGTTYSTLTDSHAGILSHSPSQFILSINVGSFLLTDL